MIRIRFLRVAGLLVFVAAVVALLDHQLPASPSPTVASPTPTAASQAPTERSPSTTDAPAERPRSAPRVPERTEDPRVANLDPALREAVRQAAADAADDGVQVVIDSGWRSPERQAELLREAIATYGSREEAARWVATPERSAHVSGDAVDIGPSAAAAWLSEHGAAYGLCRIYANEPWHFELRPDAADVGCPPMYADPTHDPRLQP